MMRGSISICVTCEPRRAEHDQAFRLLAQAPQRVAGQVADVIQPRQRRHERRGAGGDDDAFRRQRLLAAVVLGDLDMPRARDLGAADGHVDAERRVALHRVVRFDGAHDAGDALHHVGKVDLGRCFRYAVVL
jgi:hypothetical protein